MMKCLADGANCAINLHTCLVEPQPAITGSGSGSGTAIRVDIYIYISGVNS